MLQSHGQTTNTILQAIIIARLVIHFNTDNSVLNYLTQPGPFITSAEYLLLAVEKPMCTTSTFYLLANET